jgi:hypothetical protein
MATNDTKATMGTSNPEELHTKGVTNEMMTDPAFVNPGTPEKALTSEADRPKVEVSTAASNSLRTNLIK